MKYKWVIQYMKHFATKPKKPCKTRLKSAVSLITMKTEFYHLENELSSIVSQLKELKHEQHDIKKLVTTISPS
jgi:cell division protein FtsL